MILRWFRRRAWRRRRDVLLAIRLGHRYGADIANVARIGRGSVYVLLGRMEGENLIHGEPVPQAGGAPPRRSYEITPKGTAFLARGSTT